MKKSKLAGALLCAVTLTAGSIVPAMPVMADSMKVVTLGADLSEEQKNTMMNYFKVDSSQVQVLTITNQDERDHLSAYVPIEQIGTRTVSCAYVKPTESGGIKVRTANLNWVTCNMIATSLSTSGVKNCEVIAACPFEVSGTGALTGIQMAYETASGEQLDETKKQLATEEMVVTGNLADEVGKNDATTVVNQAKMDVLQNNIQSADEIQNIVVNIAEQNNVSLDSDQLSEIVSLLEQIVQQDYNYDDMKETLERVEENVTGETSETASTEEENEDPTVDAGDSIMNVDDSVLGEDVVASSTEDPTLETETGLTEDPTADAGTDEAETGDDETVVEIPEATGDDEMTEIEDPAAGETADPAAETAEELDTSILTEEQSGLFNQVKQFCTGEYEGDLASLQAVVENAEIKVVLDETTAKALADKVEKLYYDILTQGTDSYVADGTEMYMSTELNMLNKELRKLFGMDAAEETPEETEDTLADVAEDAKATLYDDTMKFFEKLYGESTEVYDESAETEENTEEIPAE